MPFIFSRRASTAVPQQHTKATFSDATPLPNTPRLQVVFKEPEITIRNTGSTVSTENSTKLQRRRHSSTSSISKASISRPTSQASSYFALPLAGQPSTWSPSSSAEPAFECPRPSPIPPQRSTSSPSKPRTSLSVEAPAVRPVSSLDIPRSRTYYETGVRRATSLKSEGSETTVFEIDEESEDESNEQRSRQPERVVEASREVVNETVKTPTSPTVRKSIFKPVKPLAGNRDGEEYRAMTVWERIGERRAREMGTVSVW